ncbi:hypothetical protein JW926_09015 [Candidatus Sumerlaeota bacterium]|nr:hypothetical protein [Candidatus Sumerlaeota bacterium]
MKMRVFIILFAASWLISPCLSQEQKSALPDDDLNQILDEAMAAASVYNWERAEKLCDCVLSVLYDNQLKARAHWIKAVAYSMFQLEYRTDSLQDKLNAAMEGVRENDPALLSEVLPRYEFAMECHLSPNPDPEKFLKQKIDLYGETAETDAANAYRLGHVYLILLQYKGDISGENQKEYEENALQFLSKACDLNPENYEYAGSYMTALYNLKRQKEIVDFGKILTARFSKAPRFSFHGDPYYLYGKGVSLSDAKKGREIIAQRAKSPDADAWIHFELAMSSARQNPPDNKASQILGEFIRRVEEKEIDGSGYNTRALASTYNELASQQFRMGLPEDALSTYRKLAALSPHYVEIHYNQGIIFKSLAEKENDPEKKQKLMERAKKEFQLQTQYNWGGKAAETARKALGQ